MTDAKKSDRSKSEGSEIVASHTKSSRKMAVHLEEIAIFHIFADGNQTTTQNQFTMKKNLLLFMAIGLSMGVQAQKAPVFETSAKDEIAAARKSGPTSTWQAATIWTTTAS